MPTCPSGLQPARKIKNLDSIAVPVFSGFRRWEESQKVTRFNMLLKSDSDKQARQQLCCASHILAQTNQTLSVEQKFSCRAFLLNMTNFACHVDQNYSTWQAILHHMTQLFVMCSNDKLLHICITPHNQFTIFAAILWFTLFWRKIHFVAIYALLCGAKFYPNILSME